MVQIATGISADPAVRFGRPVITGTRVPVDAVVARVGSGMTVEAVADEYGIRPEDVRNALQYAAHVLSQETVWVSA